ncbi:MAG: hypothetical protein JW809_07345 [Pirellulales bacterium]|nr:hypothetical protein [Pirellulales bacterium]
MLNRFLVAVCLGACVAGVSRANDRLADDFTAPPASAGCGTYWYWRAPATKENITRDLEAMRAAGLEKVLVFPFDQRMTPEWTALFSHILDEAARLRLQIVLNNDAFWSCKVPWMPPELAEKKLVFSERAFDGPRRIAEKLPPPPVVGGFYRDVAVLALRLGDDRPTDPKPDDAEAEQQNFKTARAMFPSYAAGRLDAFYRRHSKPDDSAAIPPSDVVDVTSRMTADGRLDWDAPAGRWKVLRFGYTLVCTDSPDFFSRAALDHHLRESVDKLIPLAGKHVGTTWTHVHEDSYENGAQTWTAAFRDEFRRRRGYDMTPWFPVLAGRVVGNRASSDRFLHDYRNTISDLYVENHFGYFAEQLRKRGLAFSTQGGYGWASAIADGLRIEATADAPMGEFWHAQRHPVTGQRLLKQFHVHGLDPDDPLAHRAIPYGSGLNSIRLAASAAHVHGKPYCQAESFTCYTEGGYDLCNPPYSLKATGDRAFCDGLIQVNFHTYGIQTSATAKPNEVWLGVGVHFNRNVTWWNQARAFNEYLSRCHVLLREGRFVADFAYWTGDTMPYECPDRLAMRPALPRSCNADLVNTDALRGRLTVRDGLLALPDGMTYRYLVLPPTRDTIEPASLRKIKRLVEDGATVVLGPRPVSAAGLTDYPRCDVEVQQLADVLWGTGESPERGQRALGKGRAVWGYALDELLDADNVPQDIQIADPRADFDWIHYRADDADIYFLSNQSDDDQAVDVRFRVADRRPAFWDPVWGTRRPLPEYRAEGATTLVPIRFAPRQSGFVVFGLETETAAADNRDNARNFPTTQVVMELTGPWRVQFDPKWGGPREATFDALGDWTTRPEEGIKYYSGTAVYRKTFDLPRDVAARSPLYLDLGTVKDLAEIRLNGKRLGVVWTAPWRIDVSGAIKPEGNELEIHVVNQWPNRLIGDSRLPVAKRLTESNYGLNPADPLVSSGLLGPVTLRAER